MKSTELTATTPNAISFKSEILNACTAEIIGHSINAAKVENSARIAIAKAVATISKEVDLSAEGFSNLEEYGAKCFGWKKAHTYNYRNVGIALNSGKVSECDINGKPFSFTQLIRLITADSEARTALIESGEVTAESTVAEVEDAVKATKESKPKAARKEKEVSIFCMENEEAPTAVTTPSHWKEVNGEPFHEWKQDGRCYMLYVHGGFATVYWYSTGKVVEAVAAEVVS